MISVDVMPRSHSLLLVATLTCAAAVHAEPSPDRPNIILISVDTLRADHLGCHGYARPTSPFIDSLAKEGVRCARGYAQASWTLPSHLSLLMSRYPQSHGVENDRQRLSSSVATLAEVLRNEGYATSAYISWVYLSKDYGFDRGFDEYYELLPSDDRIDDSTHASIKADRFVNRVIAGTRNRDASPFFLFLHLFDPHIDYEPPTPHDRLFTGDYRGQAEGTFEYLSSYIKGIHERPASIAPADLEYVTGLYDGEIRHVDDQLRRLFEFFREKGFLDNTVIAFTSDHGEELNDHGSMEGHQWTLYEEVIHVPMILRFPRGVHGDRTLNGVTQSIDLAPTLLSFIGAPIPDEFQGRDLMPYVRGDRPEPNDATALSQIKRFNHKWAVIGQRHKLIYTAPAAHPRHVGALEPGYELYDLQDDPREQRNPYARMHPEADRLRSILNEWMRAGRTVSPPPAPSVRLADDRKRRLRSLGYLDDEE